MFEIATVTVKNRTIEERVCNQCGQCCQDVILSISPEEGQKIKTTEHHRYHSQENLQVLDMLIFVKEEDVRIWNGTMGNQKYHYKCKNYIQREDGKGECGIYETRPRMCRLFPFLSPLTNKTKMLETYPFISQYRGCSYNINDNPPYWDDPLKK